MILTKSLEKSVDLDFEIDSIIKTGELEKLLIIVPTNRKIRYLKKEIISLTPSKVASTINLETIGTFSTRIFFSNERIIPRVLSEAASAVLLRQSFQEAKTKYFPNYASAAIGQVPAGTLERIRNVIAQYKRNGITPRTLKAESKILEATEKLKAEDIATIYSLYQQKIDQLNVKEIGDIYNSIISLSPFEFTDKFRELFPEVGLIIINGFDEFTTPEIEIIDLISLVSNSRLFLSFDYFNYNPLIFSHLDKCYRKLKKKGFEEVKDLSQGSLNEFRILVRESLFLKKKEKGSSFSDKLTVISGKNRETEISLVAKEIKDLITEKKVEPHKICVAFNLIKKYSPTLRDIFSLYGLPFNLTDRFSLSNSSPVIAIINFLEILENDYYYKNIFRALSSGYLNAGNVDLSSLLKTSADLKILAGYERWTSTLQDAISIDTGDASDSNEKLSYKKESLIKALKSLQILNSYLIPFKGKLTVREFWDRLMDLFYKLGITYAVINDKTNLVEKNIIALNTFIGTVEEIFDLLEDEYGITARFSLKFFLNQIKTAVVSARYNIKEKPAYGVQVTTINEIRGLEFDYLFICGLCDGDLPTRYTPEIFLSGSFFRLEESHHTEERYHFYQALCSWRKGLYLTYPINEEIKELMQSNFLTEFKTMFDVKIKSEADYKATIYSKEDLLKLAGVFDSSVLNEMYGEDRIPLSSDEIEKAKKISRIRRDEMLGSSPYVGSIRNSLAGDGKEWLSNLKFQQYSTSQLETYAKCPFKYFAERILKLEQIEEPTEEIEALEMGIILHNIFYEFYRVLKDKKIVLFNCSYEEFEQAHELLFSIAKKKIEEANFKSPLSFYEKEKILGLNNKKESSILFKFLLEERNHKDGFVPTFLEVNFGKIDNVNAPDPVINLKAGGISVRGKIDRIDLNLKSEEFRVVDYKLGGKKPTAEELKTGKSLQLPLYMYAAKELINTILNKDFATAGADIYSLRYKDGDFGKRSVKSLSSSRDNAKIIIKDCLGFIEQYVSSIILGEFHLTQLKDRESKICRFCNFRSICRIEEN